MWRRRPEPGYRRSPALPKVLGAVLLIAVLVAGGVLADDDPGTDAADGTVTAAPQLGPPAGEARVGSEARWWTHGWSAGDRDPDRPEPHAPRVPSGTDDAVVPAPEGATPPEVQDAPEEPPVAGGAGGAAAAAGSEGLDPGPGEGQGTALRTEEGFDVAAGSAAAGEGPTVRYTVELEPAVGADLLAVTAAVEEALTDPRSWVVDHRLERVDDPAVADVRVVLATPDTVDGLCGEAGLRTDGRYSCWNGTFAALNAMRWREGAEGFDDLTTYRRYLINHEFGHGLGHGHVDCPSPGAPAPVMMQQTMSTGQCEPNGWPYPDASDP